MKLTLPLSTALLASTAFAAPSAPSLSARQTSQPCFIIGTSPLDAGVQSTVTALASSITCSSSSTPIPPVPDVTSGNISFSTIKFADPATNNAQSPLASALSTFATASPLASTDLPTLQNQLKDYLATEAGIRSVGGSLAIKVPKFFLQFQVARVQTAQGVVGSDPADTVQHQLQKVLKNAAGESQELLDRVSALAGELS